MPEIKKLLLHLNNGNRYAVIDTNEGFFQYVWSIEDMPLRPSLKDYMTYAVTDFGRFNKGELKQSFKTITKSALNLIDGTY